MKVSLRRKIHIMALPQETFLNALWSEDQSAATPRQPGGRAMAAPVSVSAWSAISFTPLAQQLTTDDEEVPRPASQQGEEEQPDAEQEVPIHGAQVDAQAHPACLRDGP